MPRQNRRTPTASRGPLRGACAVAATSLLLTLSACSPGQEDTTALEDDTLAAVADSGTRDPAPSSSDDSTSADDDVEPTPTPPPVEEEPTEESAPEAAPPASFSIPAIDASSELLHLGLRENGTLDVPPEDPGAPASWYTGSPAPGEEGPAVLLGHVDDAVSGQGVFYDLPRLVEGDEIFIEQENGETSTFEVTKAERYGKDTFPTLEVYGNTEEPELRLITCDGYNTETGEFEENYVVYATLAE